MALCGSSDGVSGPSSQLDRSRAPVGDISPFLGNLILFLIIAISLLARVAWLSKPDGLLLADEPFYVNAARVLLHTEPQRAFDTTTRYLGSPFGLDPNTEHPPLGK